LAIERKENHGHFVNFYEQANPESALPSGFVMQTWGSCLRNGRLKARSRGAKARRRSRSFRLADPSRQ
jgi:hypothetical protein